jgi:hypothetical protein
MCEFYDDALLGEDARSDTFDVGGRYESARGCCFFSWLDTVREGSCRTFASEDDPVCEILLVENFR